MRKTPPTPHDRVRIRAMPAFVRRFRRQACKVAAHEQKQSAERRAIDALLDAQGATGWN